MTFAELKLKARSLPLEPGVYIMRDKNFDVIYVGKAKKLKNRVSQYFQDTASHSPKTRVMVSKIHDFDVIVESNEFEALVLECSLIKRHMPKYNILLKDDKGYPYLRLNMKEAYPTITLASKPGEDGALYFGPFGSRNVTQSLIKSILSIFGLPDCGRKFPRDIGKGRPCLNYHMGQCSGWCRGEKSAEEYLQIIEQVKQLLTGNHKAVTSQLRDKMCAAADALDFELAAALRNQLKAVESLGDNQLVASGRLWDLDVVGFAHTDTKACFSVIHYSDGNLIEKETEVVSCEEDPESALSAFLKQYYLNRGFAPKTVLLPLPVEDAELFEQVFVEKFHKKTSFKVPQRGENAVLISHANRNALEEIQRITSYEEKINGTLYMLGKMLSINPPKRIESFDISNISGTDVVGGMIVFEDGKPKRSAYRKFKITDLTDQDDYASMRQALHRRFSRLINKDKGFEIAPDLLLIDGGINHAKIAIEALSKLGLSIPVFGMVKDDKHRTRALVSPAGQEIGIDTQQSVFSFIGNIQEETHRYAIGYHRDLRSKRLKYSELDGIEGIGQKRKHDLLKHFKSISAIKNATLTELEHILPRNAAYNVYTYFNKNEE